MKENNNARYLLFVGSGRTGSTLVGQLLNYHPQILVSNEIRVLDRAVESRSGVDQFFEEIRQASMARLRRPSLKKRFNLFGGLRTRKWQRDWHDTLESYERSSVEKSTSILYLGDKKQGGNTRLLIRDRTAVLDALGMVDWIPISVLRDPREIVASSRRINSIDSDILRGLQHFESGIEFVREQGGIFVDYNRLLEDCQSEAVKLCENLGVAKNAAWLDLVNATVRKKKKIKAITPLCSQPIANELARITDIWGEVTGR